MRWRLALSFALSAATVGAAGDAVAQEHPEWTEPYKPFHVVGPIDYVGTAGISVYLIRTSAGLILLDAGPKEAAPIVDRNIRSLGHKLSDVKILLATHAHWDHVAALAAVKRATGARLLASPGDRKALETGVPPSDTNYGVAKFPPVKVDGVLRDGVPVRLGKVAMTPIFTPGHTPGCTSWTMTVRDRGRPLKVVFPCSLTVAGNMLRGNRGYPSIASDYRKSFARLRAIKADLVLPAHPEFGDVQERAKRRDAGDATAFIAPGLLGQLVASSQAAFEEELKTQGARR